MILGSSLHIQIHLRVTMMLLSTLTNDVAVASRLNNRRRSVGDTICSIKADSIEYILSILNSFNKNIQFTVEIEKEEKIPFLTH